MYLQKVVRHHAVFLAIILYRDEQSTTQFWKLFQKGSGSKVNLCTAFHPSTNGQVGHTIHTLEDLSMAYVIYFKGYCDNHLPLIEFSYNNCYHYTNVLL